MATTRRAKCKKGLFSDPHFANIRGGLHWVRMAVKMGPIHSVSTDPTYTQGGIMGALPLNTTVGLIVGHFVVLYPSTLGRHA
jgi:hypothetical protein